MKVKALYITSSVGLGHVTRDYHLTRFMDWADFEWLTSGAAAAYLSSRGERLLPESKAMGSLGEALMNVIKGCRVSIGPLGAMRLYGVLRHNASVLKSFVDLDRYDLIVGDEPWELLMVGTWPYERSALITDFTHFEAKGPLSSKIVGRLNSWMMRGFLKFRRRFNVGLWGQDVPGFERPGQILTHGSWQPEISDDGPILINIGGTAAAEGLAAELLEGLRKQGYEVELIGGHRLVPDPLKLVASAKVLITLAGYGSLVEVATLKKRALIMTIDGHFEHAENARAFEGRPGYRVMRCSEANAHTVAKSIEQIMREEPRPPAIVDSTKYIADSLRALAESA